MTEGVLPPSLPQSPAATTPSGGGLIRDKLMDCYRMRFSHQTAGDVLCLIASLKEKGKIRHEGSNKFGCWIVVSMS